MVQRDATNALQGNLFEGDRLRDAGIASAERNAPPDWIEETLLIVQRLARQRETFTTDDVWTVQKRHPPEPRAMGAVMTIASKRKWIKSTDRVKKSARAECHSRPIRVWQSILFS